MYHCVSDMSYHIPVFPMADHATNYISYYSNIFTNICRCQCTRNICYRMPSVSGFAQCLAMSSSAFASSVTTIFVQEMFSFC